MSFSSPCILYLNWIQTALHYENENLHRQLFIMFSLSLMFSVGAVLVDQYCNPLADLTLNSISIQLDEITEKVKKMLRIKNPSHPSLRVTQGGP